MHILNKLKYAGINEHDLLTIYKLFIRSVCEYCTTEELNDKPEAIQSTALKIILTDGYTDYSSALKYFSLDTLCERRQKHMLKFTLKCTSDSFNKKLFPHNGNRVKDVYKVDYARTGQYLN